MLAISATPDQALANPPAKTGLWAAAKSAGGSMGIFLFLTIVFQLFGILISLAFVDGTPNDATARYIAAAIVMIVPQQLAMAVTAILPRRPGSQPLSDALGLVRPACRTRDIPVLVLGALGLTLCGVVLMQAFQKLGLVGEIGASRQAFAGMFAQAPRGVAVMMVAMTGIFPGICEEMLFRGCLQRRLIRTNGPFVAITITTVCFALAHVDPAYMIFTLPIGAGLGYLAWRTGSIIPGMICHTCINLIFSGGIAFESTEADGGAAVAIALCGLGIAGLIGSALALRRLPRPE